MITFGVGCNCGNINTSLVFIGWLAPTQGVPGCPTHYTVPNNILYTEQCIVLYNKLLPVKVAG